MKELRQPEDPLSFRWSKEGEILDEEAYKRSLEQIPHKEDSEGLFQQNPGADKPIKTFMFVGFCVVVALLAYFGLVIGRH